MRDIEGSEASVFVDLGLKSAPIDSKRPDVAWLHVMLTIARRDGLSSQKEVGKLAAIEDHLLKAAPQRDLLYVGHITTKGRREFYFYAPDGESFDGWANDAMGAFPEYRYLTGFQSDPEMTRYLETLYPTPAQLQKAKNLKVLEQLKKAGDDLVVPRPVDHFAYFADGAHRDEFAEWAKKRGFQIKTSEDRDRPLVWGCQISKLHQIDPDNIHPITTEFAERCDSLGGAYDGWGCPVVRPEKSPSLWSRLFGRKD